jgi:spore maturation protein CgeB
MRMFVFGSSITSSYWNGAATYYRGIYKSLAALGHQITFAEPDIYNRQQNRDLGEIEYAQVMVYQTPRDIHKLIGLASTAELVIKHSGVGGDDDVLERLVLECRSSHAQVAFWDVDAPATLQRVEGDPRDPFRRCIPQYDFVFTYGGGAEVVERYRRLGARRCHPIYNALDPATHHRERPDAELACDLVFVGNRLPDRERRVEQFFLRAGELAPEMSFVLGGEGWGGKALPPNVRWIGHVGTGAHNRINASARMALNINRDSMADVGFSPPTRVFEAAGAATCLITDKWRGIEKFFAPGREILVAESAEEIVGFLRGTPAAEALAIGDAMRSRALAEHTYAQRAVEVEEILCAARGGYGPTDGPPVADAGRRPGAREPFVAPAVVRRA